MTDDRRTGDINVSKILVDGIGGLGLVVMASVVAYSLPQLRWVAILALIGGTAMGLLLIGARNRRARRGAAIGGAILAVAVAVAWFMFVK
jgi:hypothetical protein